MGVGFRKAGACGAEGWEVWDAREFRSKKLGAGGFPVGGFSHRDADHQNALGPLLQTVANTPKSTPDVKPDHF